MKIKADHKNGKKQKIHELRSNYGQNCGQNDMIKCILILIIVNC